MTIFDFHKRFPTEKSAIDFIIRVKYNGTYVCPFCGCVHNIYRDTAMMERTCTAITANPISPY